MKFPIIAKILRRLRGPLHRARAGAGLLPVVQGKQRARLGVYVAYFNASEIFDIHLAAFSRFTSGEFNYYVMRNCSSANEAGKFDAIAAGHRFPVVFKPWPELMPLSHWESLQRMINQTEDEIIVLCDVDAFPVQAGWDDHILRELKDKDAVGVIGHAPTRSQFKFFLHPCFLAFRRDLLKLNDLDLSVSEDNDPAWQITRWLMANGRFNPRHVAPLLPTAHEKELFAHRCHEPRFGSSNLNHGFGTTYGGFVFHLWFWSSVLRRTPVKDFEGRTIVTAEEMDEVLTRLQQNFAPLKSSHAQSSRPEA